MKRKLSIALVALAFVITADLADARAADGRHGSRGGHGPRGGHGGAQFNGRPAAPPQPAFRGPSQGHRGFVGQRGFNGHRRFEGHRGFDGHRHSGHGHRGHGGVFLGVTPFVLGGAYAAYGWAAPPAYAVPAPAYAAPAPSYWYYCQSAGAYYPDVQTCAEDWIPVPAQ